MIFLLVSWLSTTKGWEIVPSTFPNASPLADFFRRNFPGPIDYGSKSMQLAPKLNLMKPIIILSLALMLTTTTAFGQLQWGTRAGLSISTVENNTLYHQLHSSSESSTAVFPGLNAALMLKISLSNRLSLITEAQYLQKGGRRKGMAVAKRNCVAGRWWFQWGFGGRCRAADIFGMDRERRL